MTIALGVLGIIALSLLVVVLIRAIQLMFYRFDIDHICWHLIRDGVLQDGSDPYLSPTSGKGTRYAGCAYNVASSLSPVIIAHRKPLEMKERNAIHKFFPPWIRIEFQEVKYEGEHVILLDKNFQAELINSIHGIKNPTPSWFKGPDHGERIDSEIKEFEDGVDPK